MSKLEIKEQLHAYIESADEQMLKVMLDMMKFNEKSDWWDDLSNEAKVSFQRGIADLESGHYRDSAVILNEMREKYGEK